MFHNNQSEELLNEKEKDTIVENIYLALTDNAVLIDIFNKSKGVFILDSENCFAPGKLTLADIEFLSDNQGKKYRYRNPELSEINWDQIKKDLICKYAIFDENKIQQEAQTAQLLLSEEEMLSKIAKQKALKAFAEHAYEQYFHLNELDKPIPQNASRVIQILSHIKAQEKLPKSTYKAVINDLASSSSELEVKERVHTFLSSHGLFPAGIKEKVEEAAQTEQDKLDGDSCSIS